MERSEKKDVGNSHCQSGIQDRVPGEVHTVQNGNNKAGNTLHTSHMLRYARGLQVSISEMECLHARLINLCVHVFSANVYEIPVYLIPLKLHTT